MKTGIVVSTLLLILAMAEAPAESKPGKKGGPDLAVEMVEVPAGRFQIGSPSPAFGSLQFVTKGYGDERQHEVVISEPFYVAKYELTMGLYQSLMDEDKSDFKGCGKRCPVNKLTWYEAVEFCNRLSKREGLEPAYRIEGKSVTWDRTSKGYRLPTEAEWEYACRAGTTTEYNTGDTKDDLKRAGWFKGNSITSVHRVGQKEPNAWGLYDMHGNVWEWCWDWYDKEGYSDREVVDPSGPDKGLDRVTRGGSYGDIHLHCRSSLRANGDPNIRRSTMGMRVFRSK